MTAYELFKKLLVGDFDNRRQVELQKALGKQIHPFAVHVNRIFTDRVKGKPDDFEGCYILEESYYTYPEQEILLKPYLFHLRPISEDKVGLNPVPIPERWDKKECRNDNPSFELNYDELEKHPWFGEAHYAKVGNDLHVNHLCELGDGKQFSLIEYFNEEGMDVTELLEENGKRMIPYATPILYRRIP